MKSQAGNLAAPFPYFGGKSRACETVWAALGDPDNYVEPFAGSAAMLLGRPSPGKVETINDADGFVANFWRAVSRDPEAVALHADWPVNETDLVARHSWLVRHGAELRARLEADPDHFDAKIAGWWCWGACAWMGSGWCSGRGPWVHDGERLVDRREESMDERLDGISRRLPGLARGKGINRQIPRLSGAQGINRSMADTGHATRGDFIREWFNLLRARTRDVRVACGDWSRVLTDSVTRIHGLTGVFLDPPYTKGDMDYAAGGCGGELAGKVRDWCAANGSDPAFRVVICGHAGEHDALLPLGWTARGWTARLGYARSEEARQNSAGETVWCSPHCVPERHKQAELF